MPLKQNEGSARGPAEAIDGLVGVADRENVALGSRKLLQDPDLRKVDILKFVHQDEASARPPYQIVILLQQVVGVGDHVAEGSQLVLAQHALHGGEYTGDFTAPPDDFLVRHGDGVFRFGHPRNRQLATFDFLHILFVFFRTDEFVMTMPKEGKQVVKKLAEPGGADKVVQVQFANAAAEINPEVLIVEDAKLPVDFG